MLEYETTIDSIRDQLPSGYQLRFAYDKRIEPESTDDETWQIYDSHGKLHHTLYINNGVVNDSIDH